MEKGIYDFIQELFFRMGIPTRRVTLPCGDWSWLDHGLRENVLGIADCGSQIEQKLRAYEDDTVYFFTDVFHCSYTSFRMLERDSFYFIGPLLFERVDAQWIDRLLRSLDLPERLREPLQSYYADVKFLPDRVMYDHLIIQTGEYAFGKGSYRTVYEDAGFLDRSNAACHDRLRIPEEPFRNTQRIESRYAVENAIIAAVFSGNEGQAIEQFRKMAALPLPQRLTNTLRDRKDLCITINTLLRKTAENTGVHPVHIDSYSNRNIQSIEAMTSEEQCVSFAYQIIHGYCRLITEYPLKDYSPPIRQAVTYINTDLTADLSLKSLAGQINVNASYLSTLFKREVGVPLTEYVNRCRIDYAKKLLQITNLPIKAVALQCGIPDMQYFGRMFKRQTGVTPRSYQKSAGFEVRRMLRQSPQLNAPGKTSHPNRTGAGIKNGSGDLPPDPFQAAEKSGLF